MNNFSKPNISSITPSQSSSSSLQNSSINSQRSKLKEFRLKNRSSQNKHQSNKKIQDIDSMIVEKNVQESFDSEKSKIFTMVSK